MKILCLGDVYGNAGCLAVRTLLPEMKKQYNIDMVIANGENSAEGNGILPHSAAHLFDSGVDVITGGNHTLRRQEIYPMLEENERLLRPANYPASAPGHGICVLDFGYCRVGVINLAGAVYTDAFTSPFAMVDDCIAKAKKQGADIILVDLHAEATSEKRAMGFYLDGQISAIFGTHTHVATADAQVLPQGTGYITDLGMCGTVHSVLGVAPEIIVERFTTMRPTRFQSAVGPAAVSGCIFDIDKRDGRCHSAEYIYAKERNRDA
ncbi:MAG: TIGR00282 family metallophosphoesterase [Clostridia bacterium]|nr:TIGR00282 family metallophosphoesterase [Clostridia bacterium]